MDLKLLNNPNIKWPYIALDYIESTGTQYIDTLVKPKKSIGIYVDFQYTTTATQQYLFGHTYSSGSSGISYAFYINGNGIFASGYRNGQGDWTATGIAADTNRHTLEFNVNNDKAIKIDGGETYSSVLTNTPSNTGNASLILFGRRDRTSGTINNLSKLKIYEVKIYDNGVLIKDMIPAINVADNSIGLLDNIGKEFYPNQGTNYFTGTIKNTDICSYITSLYIKDCPNIQSINILRNSINVNRVRINIGDQSGTMNELYKYSILSGFNDAYEKQIKPRIVGAFTIDYYYSNEELDYLNSTIDGLTINVDDPSKNINDLLETDELRLQTLDSTKPNYNPAAAIVMHNAGYDINLNLPIVEGEGTWCRPKSLPTTITTQFRGITTIVDTEGVISSDTTAEYDFENFEEFQYFDNTSISAGSSSSATGAFGNCTSLKKIILPNTITTIGAYAFYGCTSLKSINIPSGVTSIGQGAFCACTSLEQFVHETTTSYGNWCFEGSNNLKYIKIKPSSTNCTSILGGLNIPNGEVHLLTGVSRSNGTQMTIGKLFIYGDLTQSLGTYKTLKEVRINGITGYSTMGSWYPQSTAKFFEVMGNTPTISGSNRIIYTGNIIFHSGYNGLISTTPTCFGIDNCSKLYVGDGSSRQNDENVLALYLADSNWSGQSSKLATWYDYNGEYKWYYVTDNLTNCTNTNPDEWPHITRGESYHTVIKPNEGMTLDSVTVEMYEAVDNGTTPDTPTDITSSVYNESTGEINISSVTGNIIITASAS